MKKPSPDERPKFRYLCPICFKYFNHIYSFRCCENYICHKCTDDLIAKFAELNLQETLCIFCRREKPVLDTVDWKKKSRKYEDLGDSSKASGSGSVKADLGEGPDFGALAWPAKRRRKEPKKSMHNLDTSKFEEPGRFPLLAFRLHTARQRRNSL